MSFRVAGGTPDRIATTADALSRIHFLDGKASSSGVR